MDKKQKLLIIRIIVSAIIVGVTWTMNTTWSIPLVIGLYIIAYMIVSYDIIKKSIINIMSGEVFDENFLMTIASIGAFLLHQYTEGIAVMWLYQVGELLQDIAVDRSRDSIKSLMELKPEVVHIKDGKGLVDQDPEKVDVGTSIIVKVGELVPLDGIVESVDGSVDLSAITGEALPVDVKQGENISSGALVLDQQLEVKTTKAYHQSTTAKMADLVEKATMRKARSEKFITKFAHYYTPVVVCAAVALAIIPLFFAGFSTWHEWLYRALIFLVVSCPCALVISVPLSFFAGIGGASKQGILIKGNEYVEDLTQLKTIVFDKTGTLTTGQFSVQTIVSEHMSDDDLLNLMASLEQYSTHPIAQAIVKANTLPLQEVTDYHEVAGHGIKASVNHRTLLIGNEALMTKEKVLVPMVQEVGTVVYLAVDGQYVGYVIIKDTLKATSIKTIKELTRQHIDTIMVTGDRKEVADAFSHKLGLTKAYSEQCPEDKVARLEEAKATSNGKVAFIGDGINDAPVIAQADIGMAMGGVGSDIAIEAADIVLMDDDPHKIETAIKGAKRTIRIVKQNIIFALVVKMFFLILAMFGITTMEWAIIADVGVAIIAVVNAMRALKWKN